MLDERGMEIGRGEDFGSLILTNYCTVFWDKFLKSWCK